MIPAPLITTSWDDGHPLDLRIAEMLDRHNLRGTFYVPRMAETETMTPAQVRTLGASFELGAHTLGHRDLTHLSDDQARSEIVDSRAWLEDTTGQPCLMFCPPLGRYARRHLAMIHAAGFLGMRTVELVSIARPRPAAGLLIMPTTIQAHPHRRMAFARNFARRAAAGNLWRYLLHARSNDWRDLARSLLATALRQGGVFHLWGHSWEVEATGQWNRLEEVFQFLGGFVDQAAAVSNLDVCRAGQSMAAEQVAPPAQV